MVSCPLRCKFFLAETCLEYKHTSAYTSIRVNIRRLRPRPRSSLTIIHKSLCVLRSRLVRTMSLDEPHDKEARHGFPLTHQGFLERSTFHLPMESLDEPPCRDSMLHPLFKIEPHPPACLSDKGENRNWAGRLGHTNTHTCI